MQHKFLKRGNMAEEHGCLPTAMFKLLFDSAWVIHSCCDSSDTDNTIIHYPLQPFKWPLHTKSEHILLTLVIKRKQKLQTFTWLKKCRPCTIIDIGQVTVTLKVCVCVFSGGSVTFIYLFGRSMSSIAARSFCRAFLLMWDPRQTLTRLVSCFIEYSWSNTKQICDKSLLETPYSLAWHALLSSITGLLNRNQLVLYDI